jgi:hypothetical protein
MRVRARRPRTGVSTGLTLQAAVALLTVCCLMGIIGCSSSKHIDAGRVRTEALAALAKQPAWKVTTEQFDGRMETEWWSANSPYYRWDDGSGNASKPVSATDGKSLFQPGPDGAFYAQGLGADAGRPVNPTAFSTYYWYLKQGRPIDASASSGDSKVVKVVLKDAPSNLTFLLDPGTYLPVGFTGKSEMTAQKGTSKVTLQPVDIAAVKDAVEQLASLPPSSYPNVTAQDHLVNELRAAGIDCFWARSVTDSARHVNVLYLTIEVAPAERGAAADEGLALRVVPPAHDYRSRLDIGMVDVTIVSVDKAPDYEKTFDLRTG